MWEDILIIDQIWFACKIQHSPCSCCVCIVYVLSGFVLSVSVSLRRIYKCLTNCFTNIAPQFEKCVIQDRFQNNILRNCEIKRLIYKYKFPLSITFVMHVKLNKLCSPYSKSDTVQYDRWLVKFAADVYKELGFLTSNY